jgi:hypothetical protein
MRREPRWCVAEVSDDGKMKVISPAFESTAEAEERKVKLLKEDKYGGKNLQVIRAPHPVDPRKPTRQR